MSEVKEKTFVAYSRTRITLEQTHFRTKSVNINKHECEYEVEFEVDDGGERKRARMKYVSTHRYGIGTLN